MSVCHWRKGQYICEMDAVIDSIDFKNIEVSNMDPLSIETRVSDGTMTRRLVVC